MWNANDSSSPSVAIGDTRAIDEESDAEREEEVAPLGDRASPCARASCARFQ